MTCTGVQSVVKEKNHVEDMRKKGVIYRIPCMDCTKYYIGEIGRNLQKWLMEQKYNIGDWTNRIAVHVYDQGHQVNSKDP